MSSRFVHAHGKEGRLTRAREPRLRRACAARYARAARRRARDALGDRRRGAARHGRGVAAVLVSRERELAPVEDQSHISLFIEASPDASLEAVNRASLEVVRRDHGVPRGEVHVVAHRRLGRLRRHGRQGLEASATRSTEEMYGEVFGAVSQIPGLRVFPRLDPPLPTPGQYDVELVLQSDAPPEQMLETVGAVVGAGWQSGKFLYVDTDLKIDLPEARVVIDREQVADLGLDLAGVGRELGTLLGGGYVNRFNFFDRSYKVIPQIGDEDRATVGPLLDLKIKTPSGELVPVSTFTRIESSTAPRTLNRFQQRNAVRVFGGVKPGVTKEEGLRVLEDAARAAGGPGVIARLRRRIAADPPRGLGAHRHARLRGRAHLPRARGAVPELPRSADRAARLGAAGDLRRAGLQLPRPHDDQHLLAGRPDHARRPDREERHPDRAVREHAAGAAASTKIAALREAALDAAAAGADDLGRDGVRPLPARVRLRARAPRRATASAPCSSRA